MTRMKLAALTALVALAACVPGDGPQIGRPAIEYPAATLEGDTVTLASLHGDVVLLNLWATWCVPCREETPFLQALYEEHADRGFHIVGISQDTRDAADQVEIFVEEYGVTYTILHDPQMRGQDIYRVPGMPATFLIDREGVIRWLRFGPILEGDAEFLEALDAVLS